MIQVEALYEVYHTSSTCDQLYVLSMLRTYCLDCYAETLAVICSRAESEGAKGAARVHFPHVCDTTSLQKFMTI